MRIGFDAKRAFHNRTGLGNYSRSTLTQLSRYFPEAEQFLFTPSIDSSGWKAPESCTIITPSKLQSLSPALWRSRLMLSDLRRISPDLYHGLSHELPYGIEKTGIRSIVTIHDLIFLRFPSFYRTIDRLIYERKFRHACQVANLVIAISEQTKNDLIQFFAIPAEKIQVVYQACHSSFYQQVPLEKLNECRIRYKLPEKFMLTVGNVEHRKNLLGILKAMEQSNIEFPLVVIGRPASAWDEVQSFLRMHPAKYPLVFISGVSFDDLPALYQLADFSIYPSFFEGFGLPVLESMASGCPVITSNLSSMPEAAGNAALLMNPAKPAELSDAILQLIQQPTKRAEMKTMGYQQAQLFNEKSVATNLMQTYRQVINS
jgi:glycosyltransferase involved in cell wall biosynthesis